MKKLLPLLLMILLAPLACAEVHGWAGDVGKEGLEYLSYSVYALAVSIVISSCIIGSAISGRRK